MGGGSTILVIIMGNGAIAPGDSLALIRGHLRVSLNVKDTSIVKHPRHRRIKNLEEMS